MKIFSKIFSNHNDTQIDNESTVSVDNIFSYLQNFINRKELAEECSELKKKADALSGEEKEIQLTRAYFCFEKFVTGNKPLIVKREIEINELRKEIINKGFTNNLFSRLELPFVNERERFASVFAMATRDIVKYLKGNIGEDNFKTILNNSLIGNRLSGKVLLLEDSLKIEIGKDMGLEQISIDELRYSLKNLFENITKEVISGFGNKIADAILQSSFTAFKFIYPLEFLKIFLDILPSDFLMEEKTYFLAKEELQKKLLEAVGEERLKSIEADMLSKRLQEALTELGASKSAVLNLLEDVNVEKNIIEKEIRIRTGELMSEKAFLRATINSIPLAYFLINTDFVLLESNPALSRVFSVEKISSFSEIESMFDGFFPIRERCQSVFSSMKMEVFKDVSLANKFFKLYLQSIVSVETGEKIGLLGLIEDITEQKILDRSKDEFFSIASHELRTPLTAIMGNTSMILEFFGQQLQNKEIKQMVEDVHEASIRLLKIVGDFLDVSRLEQGKIIFKSDKFNMRDLIMGMLRDFESAATLKGLSLKIGEMPRNSFVTGDKDKVKQIVSNLISNAINYTSKGEISVYIKKDEPGHVSLYVKDSGIGVSKENQILLFRKFQQAQEKLLTRDASRSTGLGLYISRLLAISMNGRVELVESSQGKGSVFKLVLPF
ncbi:MAG: Multi-sensor signal transduction histidine kinase [Parcubacteria group bacterium GW2011_GWF2_38_76]|nr:MAG: Multi-sensor signal transduction histidine kinase [Parcubacteria group bacterium GW2011_GWF2_38_76]HBM45700.1 hypothetical protein [Patescibacteria group bacterium]